MIRTPPMHYMKASRGRDGRYRLFFVGTANEVFPCRSFSTAAAARQYAAARAALEAACQQVGAEAAADIDGVDDMTTEEIRDQIAYLSDYQG